MTTEKAKKYLIDHFCTMTSVLYIDSDADFEIIQNAHKDIINTSHTKILRSRILLKNINSYAEFKELKLMKNSYIPEFRKQINFLMKPITSLTANY